MSQHTIRVLADGRHHVGVTETGRDWTPIGVSFKSPRDAITFADRLDAASRPAPETHRSGADQGAASPPGAFSPTES